MPDQGFDFESLIIDIPDYPEPGVVFKDITPLFDDAQGLAAVVDAMADHFAGRGVTKVVGAEARGFLVGALEYGTDELQMHQDALDADDRVLIVDDLIATGGTAVAAAKLAEQAGATVEGFSFILELEFLKPRDIIAKDYKQEVFSLVKVS